MLTMTYIAFAVLGCGYVLIAAFLGHATDFGGGHAASAGHAASSAGHAAAANHATTAGHTVATGHSAGAPAAPDSAAAYGVQGGGHGAALATAPAPPVFHFPFFSPLALATLMASVGGFGLVAQFGFHAGDTASLLIAIPAALATAYAVTYAAWKIAGSAVATSVIRLADLDGALAEITTPIPAGGTGEALAIVRGQRYTASAREAGGGALARGTPVAVVGQAGATLIVSAELPFGGADPRGVRSARTERTDRSDRTGPSGQGGEGHA
jgi:hypothetical protein